MPWTNAARNKILDAEMRDQPYTYPAQWWVAIFTATPTDTTAGTEIPTSGTNYGRQAIDRSLTAWSGTQGAGTTAASSSTTGAYGESSNNASIIFPTPTTDWGTAVALGLFTAETGGTLWRYHTLDTSKALFTGDPVYFPASALKIRAA
jgi:hypothetical protein